MKLPIPPGASAMVAELEREDKKNYKRDRNLGITPGTFLVLASPDGSLFGLTVSNSGVLGTTAL